MKSMGSGWENLKIQLALKGLTPSSVNYWFLPRVLKFISIEKLGSSSFSSSMFYNLAHVMAGKQGGILSVTYYPLHTAEYETDYLASDWLYFL